MTESCLIRLMTEGDLERVLTWRNHPSIRQCMLTQHEIGLDEHRRWFGAASLDPRKRLLIVEDGPAALGFVSFSGVERGGTADWGFYAAPDAPKGTGRKLGTLALAAAFQEMGVHKVCGQSLAFNTASIRFHQSLGFCTEGILREQHRVNGAYHDLICFGLLQDEWSDHDSR